MRESSQSGWDNWFDQDGGAAEQASQPAQTPSLESEKGEPAERRSVFEPAAPSEAASVFEPAGSSEVTSMFKPAAPPEPDPIPEQSPSSVLAALAEPALEPAPTPTPAPIISGPPEPFSWSAPPAPSEAVAQPEPSAWNAPAEPDAELASTQWVPSASPFTADTPTQVVPPSMADCPTQFVPPPGADLPTRIVPDAVATQRVTPTPPPPHGSTPSSAWPEPRQPAQMWGAPARASAAQEPGYGGHGQQPPSASHAAPTAPAPQQGDEWADWGDDSSRRRVSPPPAIGGGSVGTGSSARTGTGGTGGSGGGRSRKKFAVAGTLGGAVILGVVIALVLNQSGTGHSTAAPKPSGFQPTATAPAGAAEETADAFLSAWQSGNFQQAADLTDNPTQALATLTAYRSNLSLAGLQLAAQNSTAAGAVTFSVNATVGLASSTGSSASAAASASSSASPSASTAGTSGSTTSPTANWSYTSHLTAYEKNGGWWVKWTPALVAPSLTATTKVVTVAIPAQADEVADSAGNDISDAEDPGLRNIASELKKNVPIGQGTPGVEVELQNADGTVVAGTAAKLSAPVNTSVIKTTIDPQDELAAMHAVSLYPQSAMVVLQPTTGDILAVANNAGGNDYALMARIAPGSTNKIITSTALLASGLVSSPSQGVQCPKAEPINGMDFGNSGGESLPAGTPFLTDFADSCNNAFSQWYSQIGSTTLAQTAQKYYGLNQEWNIGIGPGGPYYVIPPSSSNGELAMELFGQGQLQAAPLAMASVAATVDTGTFMQPIVVPGAAQLTATPLPSNVKQDLWQMMHAVTQTGGTAADVYSGVSDEVYAKTGTADEGATSAKPNSWMVVFDPTKDLAIGCVVLGAGFGAAYAGPETASVLEALR